MDQDYIKSELNDVFNMLNTDDNLELEEYIADLLEDDRDISESPYEIANALCSAAPAKSLSRCVFDFIVEMYEAEIENGNENAMNDLGALYYDGRGCEQDYTKAIYYYDMAAKHGSRLAQENLGYCYYYGRNMAVDYEKAYHYFALGALSGMPVSLYKLGDMYQNGYYVEKNEKEAFRIYDHCLSLLNDSTAKFAAGPVYLRLGNAFLYGRGTNEDSKAALICFQKAEIFLYDMVKNGNAIYKDSLTTAIDGQTKSRAKMTSDVNNCATVHKVKKIIGPFVLIHFHKNTGKISRTLEAEVETELILFGKENTPKTKDCIVFSKITGEVVFYFTGETQSEINNFLGNINEYCPGFLEAVNGA